MCIEPRGSGRHLSLCEVQARAPFPGGGGGGGEFTRRSCGSPASRLPHHAPRVVRYEIIARKPRTRACGGRW